MVMKIYISLVLSLFIVAHAPLHAITPYLIIPTEKLSLTDCLKPRNQHIRRAMDAECPLTFQEGTEWIVNTELNVALAALLKKHAISPAGFNSKFAELSRQYDAHFFAGKVAITYPSEVPTQMQDLINRCAQEMHCYDRILVTSNSDATETALIRANMPTGKLESLKVKFLKLLQPKKEPAVELNLNLNKLAQFSAMMQEFIIKHEIAHAQKRHSIMDKSLLVLVPNINSQND